MAIDLIALALAGIHFGAPLIYYWRAKSRWLRRPWGIRVDDDYRPRVTVVIPTYDEATIIEGRLNNLYAQDYPKELMEIFVVDSASEDGTAEIVKRWSEGKDINLKLLVEDERKGKFHALKAALEQISPKSEIVVFTDADASWEPDSLSIAAKYLADNEVGSVTASITYGDETIENVYRGYFNTLRVAESKIHSTAIHNGPFLAIRGELIRKMGLPDFLGSDDSAFGSFIAFGGYRAIQVDDITVKEPMRGNPFLRKVRRAQHLLLSFLTTKRYAKKRGLYRRSSFDRIWKVEWWLHVINPWLLLISVGLFVINMVLFKSLVSSVLLLVGLALSASKTFRTWVLQQFYLTAATVRNLWTKEIAWRK